MEKFSNLIEIKLSFLKFSSMLALYLFFLGGGGSMIDDYVLIQYVFTLT